MTKRERKSHQRYHCQHYGNIVSLGQEDLIQIQKDRTIPALARPGRKPVHCSTKEKDLICKAWKENDAPCAVILERIHDFQIRKTYSP